MINLTEQLRAFAERAGISIQTVTRVAVVNMTSRMVLESPVGNADLWKSNSHREFARKNYNALAALKNNATLENPASYSKRGRLKVKLIRALSGKQLRKQFPNVRGRGYVGGRFRANWMAGINAPNKTTTESVNAQDSWSEIEKLKAAQLGGVLYFTNSLPYSRKIEYGHSKQAPAGVVRLNVQRFEQDIKAAIAEVKK